MHSHTLTYAYTHTFKQKNASSIDSRCLLSIFILHIYFCGGACFLLTCLLDHYFVLEYYSRTKIAFFVCVMAGTLKMYHVPLHFNLKRRKNNRNSPIRSWLLFLLFINIKSQQSARELELVGFNFASVLLLLR